MMVESGVGRVPIIDHESRRVVGIISRQDLLKVRVRHRDAENVRTRMRRLGWNWPCRFASAVP